jgi:hypothetical protein
MWKFFNNLGSKKTYQQTSQPSHHVTIAIGGLYHPRADFESQGNVSHSYLLFCLSLF